MKRRALLGSALALACGNDMQIGIGLGLGFGGAGGAASSPPSSPLFIAGRLTLMDPTGANAAIGANDINTICHRNDAIFSDTTNAVRYGSWYRGSDGQLVVGKATTPNGAWTATLSTAAAVNTGDDHRQSSGCVDSTGRYLLAFGMHSTTLSALNFARATNPGDTALAPGNFLAKADGTVGPLVAGNTTIEANCAYPAFVQMPNGKVLFTFRTGSSGLGNQVLYLINGLTITSVYNTLIDGVSGSTSAYINTFWVEGTTSAHPSRIWLSWSWRDSNNPLDAHDLYAVYSDDEGVTWKSAGGTTMTIPMSQANAAAALVEAVPIATQNWPGQQGMCVNTRGEPIICMYKGSTVSPAAFTTSIYCWIYRNGSWSRVAMSNPNFNFNGSDAIAASRPLVFYYPPLNATICMYSMATAVDTVGKFYFSYSTNNDLSNPVTKTIDVLNAIQDVDASGFLLDSRGYNDGAGELIGYYQRSSVSGTDPANGPYMYRGTIAATAATELTPIDALGAHDWIVDTDHIIDDGSGNCLTWTDFSGNGRNFTQGVQANRGIIRANELNGHSAVEFDAVNDFYNMTFSRSAPATQNYLIWFLMKQVAWTNGMRILHAQGAIFFQTVGSPNIRQNHGTSSNSSPGAPVGAYALCFGFFSGSTADYISCGASKVGGISSGNVISGTNVTLGADATGASGWSRIKLVAAGGVPVVGAPTTQQVFDLKGIIGRKYGANLS